MLSAIYQLGKLYIEKENLNELDVLLDEKDIGAVLSVNLIEKEDGELVYEKIIQEDYDAENKLKYLYKKGSSRGINISPSSLITNDVNKTWNIKFFKWFEKNKKSHTFIEKIYNLLKDQQEKILEDIIEIHSNIDLNNNILLTLRFSKNNNDLYVGDIDIFKEMFKEFAFDKYKKYSKKDIKGNSACFLCEENKEVFGVVSSGVGFSFSTPEKIGNIPGIQLENQWKLAPICGDCALYLEAGKKFIEKYLNFSEFGLSFYVIPNFLFDYRRGFDKLYPILSSLYSSERQNSDDVVIIENKLYKLVKNIDDIIEFKFLFYEANNNAFNILAYVESVIPSWLNELFESQFKIANFDFFRESNLKNIFNDKHSGSFIELINLNEKNFKCSYDEWYKKFLKDFTFNFSKKIYIDLVSDILSHKKLDYNFLINRFMNKLRLNWRNEENHAIRVNVLKSLMLLLLLNDMNLIKGVKIMNLGSNEEFDIDLLLNTSDKKATFLLGVLTRRLLNKQYKELNSSPFYNKLWGLSLDKKKIKKLYPMVVNKLREYDVAYPEIEESISINLVNANNDWNLNRDETSYFFVLGFTLPYFNKTKKDDDLNE